MNCESSDGRGRCGLTDPFRSCPGAERPERLREGAGHPVKVTKLHGVFGCAHAGRDRRRDLGGGDVSNAYYCDGAGFLEPPLAAQNIYKSVQIVSIYEAGLNGFWVHRVLEASDVESPVVDAASIAVNRRSRMVTTGRIDVETLLCTW